MGDHLLIQFSWYIFISNSLQVSKIFSPFLAAPANWKLMIWTLQIALSTWFGYEFVSYLARNNLDIVERFFAGIPLGFICYSWAFFFASANMPLRTNLSYIICPIFAFFSLFFCRKNKKLDLCTVYEFNILKISTLVIVGIYLIWSIHTGLMHNGMFGKGATYGDGPFHMNIASSFSNGVNNRRNGIFNVSTPFFSGERLSYPMIPNFFSGVLMATGQSTWVNSFHTPSYFMVLSFLVAQYSLCYKYSKSHLTSFISIIIFLNLSGTGWVKFISYPGGTKYPTDWVFNWGDSQFEFWFHSVLQAIVPQRASLFSFSLCYWTILFLIIAIEKEDWKMFFLAGIFTGFTPQIQVHSFAALAQWAIIYCLVTFPFSSKNFQVYFKRILLWALFAIVANAIAIPQLFPFFHRIGESRLTFVKIRPLLLSSNEKKLGFIIGPIVMWWRALGTFWVIAQFLGFASATNEQIKMYLPSLFIFFTSNIIQYQPWSHDNSKLFFAGWVPVALPFVSTYLTILAKNKKTLMIAIALIFSCTFSGVLFTSFYFFRQDRILNQEEINFGFWVSENTPPKSLFLCSQWHGNTVSGIAGRQIFCGFPGWAWTHGLSPIAKIKTSNLIMNDPNHYMKLVLENNISYIAVKKRGETNFTSKADKMFYAKIFDTNSLTLYKIIPKFYRKPLIHKGTFLKRIRDNSTAKIKTNDKDKRIIDPRIGGKDLNSTQNEGKNRLVNKTKPMDEKSRKSSEVEDHKETIKIKTKEKLKETTRKNITDKNNNDVIVKIEKAKK